MMIAEFLSVGSCLPENEQGDTASLLVDGKIMVDTGWFALRNLMRAGAQAKDVKALFFTHMHQDHYLGLPQLLFYLMNSGVGFDHLKIYGPEGVEEVVAQALTFGGYERYYSYFKRPEVQVMQAGDVVRMDGVEVTCVVSQHAIESRGYRFTNVQTGESFAYSGDTAPFDGFGEFAKGCKVVIHEASFDVRETPKDNPYCHASCMDAARMAVIAGAQTLYMVHARGETAEATVEKAKTIFADPRRPVNGERFEF